MGRNGYFKETIIFEEFRQGATNFSDPTYSKVMGPNCIFSIETNRARCFPGVVVGGGVSDSLPPLDSCIACVHVSMFVAFKDTKNVACSKFFEGIGVHGHLKI